MKDRNVNDILYQDLIIILDKFPKLTKYLLRIINSID